MRNTWEEQSMGINQRQLIGLLGIGIGGVAVVMDILLYHDGIIGLWFFSLIGLPSVSILLLAAGYLYLENQTLAVLNGPS